MLSALLKGKSTAMKKCELCNSIARVYCESDQASLCWDCDAMVHTANFLVAKHSRSLLCHGCQSLTPWTSSGQKLSPIALVCEACVINRNTSAINGDRQNNAERDEDDDGDNQVVPMSTTPLPLSVASSNSSKESSRRYNYRGKDRASSSRTEVFF